MSLDELPGQFEAFVERARAALSQEITTAKNIIAAANAEKSAAQNAGSNLEARCKSTQDQLDALNDELAQRTTLAGLNRGIAAASKKLKALQAETAEAEKALEALNKQRADGEAKLVALGNEMSRLRGERSEATTEISNIKALLQQVQIGQRP